METVDCIISRVVFHKSSKYGAQGGIPYLIARCNDGLTIKGQMRTPVIGQKYRLWGSLRPQKGGYPDAFEFSSFEALCDKSTGGITTYLRKNIFGIGIARATAIVEAFGDETLDILRSDPFRVMAVEGITEDHVEAIRIHFSDTKSIDPVACAKLTEMFHGYRFPKKLVESCVKAWGSSAPEVVRDNPYLLINFPRVGWKLVDAFAMGYAGYPDGGLARHVAALVEALTRLGNDGHTAATRSELMRSVEHASLLGGRLHADALKTSIDDGHVVVATDGVGVVYQLAAMAHAEATIADRLKTLGELGPHPIGQFIDPSATWISKLGVDQVYAAESVGEHPVSIVTGPPGTGKSYLVSRLILQLREMGHSSIRCCAPTGKAAKRMAELLMEVDITDIPCSTIHKALEPGPPEQSEEGVPKDDAKFGRGRDGWGFKRHIANPLDEKIVIIEEPSMLDAKLAASLLSAIAPGTRVIFVGDCNQLPSVGAGSVLRDMVAAGIPTATLSQIRRSDTCGTVVHACHAIINDRIPVHADKVDLPRDNWVHIEVDDPHEIAAEIVKLNTSIKTFDRMWGIQVISPQKAKLPFGCDNLNILLSKALNPDNHCGPVLTDPLTGEMIGVSDGEPKIGDKVVRTKNAIVDELILMSMFDPARPDLTWDDKRWMARECPVVNGDMGTVVDILSDAILVRFRDPDRLCRLPISDPEINLAYAMTVHKCVHPDTLVETPDGILPIKDLTPSGIIATPNGVGPYRDFVENPIASALKITTEGGYSITVTPDHSLEVWRKSIGPEMTIADSITVGDRLSIRLGLTCGPDNLRCLPPVPPGDVRAIRRDTPKFVDERVAEFLGLMVADGTIYKRGFRLVKRHAEVREKFAEGCRHLFGIDPKPIEILGTPGYEVNSTLIRSWMELIGGLSPKKKDVPDCILQSPIGIQAAFIRGLFEDGGVNLNEDGKCDHIEWTSIYPDMRNKVRVMLLRMGIITGDTNYSPHRLYIYGHHAFSFANTIGFITTEKQKRALTAVDTEKRYIIPVSKGEIDQVRRFVGSGSFTNSVCSHAANRGYISRQLGSSIVSEGILPEGFIRLIQGRLRYYYPRVKKIELVECPSMCVEVPDGHRFLQNGFVGSNCQGSGFPCVIFPIHNNYYFDTKSNSGIWCRELAYTALSRTEKLLITVGQWAALETAIGRKTVNRRRTTLEARIRGLTIPQESTDGIPEPVIESEYEWSLD